MTCAKRLEVHSDSGFRKEEKDGIATGKAQRGANFLRLGSAPGAGNECSCHLLDWHCGTLKVVTRSTFASETQAAIAAADAALMLALTLHEIHAGPVTPRQGMDLLQDGGLCFDINLGVDAMNLVSAIANIRLRTPSERSMLCQLLWLKERWGH